MVFNNTGIEGFDISFYQDDMQIGFVKGLQVCLELF
jgi:hypothetical protein